jgi:hypothetical protein
MIGHGSSDDQDQAGAGMGVPAGGRSGRELVVDDVDVGLPVGLELGLPGSGMLVWALTWIPSKSDLARMVVVTPVLGLARAGRTIRAAATSTPMAAMAVRIRVRWRSIAPAFRSGRWSADSRSLGLPLVPEVVDLAVEGGDLAAAWAVALPGWFVGAEVLLALEEPVYVLAAAAVWSGGRGHR